MNELTVAIYQVYPPEGVGEDDFVQFVKSEVFPAVDTSQTRAGKVTGQRLFKAVEDPAKYIWIVEYTRMGGLEKLSTKTAAAVAKLTAKGARSTGFGDYDEIRFA